MERLLLTDDVCFHERASGSPSGAADDRDLILQCAHIASPFQDMLGGVLPVCIRLPSELGAICIADRLRWNAAATR